MEIETEDMPGGVVKVILTGALDIAGAEAVDHPLEVLADGRRPLIMVDLQGVTVLASMGLRSLITAAKRVQEHGGRIVLAGPNPMIRRLLLVSGVDKLLPVGNTEGDALRLLQK